MNFSTLRPARAVRGTLFALAATVVGSLLLAAPARADHRTEFIDVAGPAAQVGQAQYQVPASVTVGQAILESGWGRSKLSANDQNYFGIKCTSSSEPGPIATGCHRYDTTECTPDCHTVQAYFRVYASMADSFRDHGRLLKENPRYANAFKHTDDPDQFIRDIANDGYATDPHYADLVIQLMQDHDLYRFDHAAPSPRYSELTAVGNETGDGSPELLAVQGAANGGTLWRYTVGHDSVGSRVQVGTGWDGMHDLAAVGDMNGDGKGDLLAIEKKTGKLWLYYGPGFSGADGQRKQLGTGWNAMEELTAVGDIDGDGKGDLLAAEIETGKLWLYHGPNFSGADGQRQQVGTNWDSMNELTNVGDVDGDGHQDVVAVEASTGKLFLYNGPSFSGASRQQVGTGWNRMRSLASPGNRTGDQAADLLAIDEPTGHLYLYRGPGFSGTTRLDLGGGWNG